MSTNTTLTGRNIAILATDGFERSELVEPRKALQDAGAKTVLVSLKPGSIKSWDEDNWGPEEKVDLTLEQANPAEFDGLLLPGGVQNPDTLRQDRQAVDFVRAFFAAGKPVAAICHGPQVLIEASVVDDREVTSYPSIKTDLINAGARWRDAAVVNDQGLVTSRRPSDIPEFNAKMIEEFAEGIHAGQRL
jgi:protease I